MGVHGGSLFPIPLVSLFGIHPDTSLGSPGNALRSARLRLFFLVSQSAYFRLGIFREATLRDSRNGDQPGVSPGTVYGSQATLNGPGFTVGSDIRAIVFPLISLSAFCRTIPTAGLQAGSMAKKVIIYLLTRAGSTLNTSLSPVRPTR